MQQLTIGPYQLASQLVLAPMAGITDEPFRELCKEFGAGMTVAEMLTSDSSIWHSRKSSLRLINSNSPEPRAIQIAGSEPEQMAQAAVKCQQLGAQLVDINMGCPAKKVCKKAAGSALLRDEQLVAAILEAVVSAVSIPVTLKIRTGWDQQNKNALQIGRIAQESGIQALAIHGRTREERFMGQAEYDTIAQVKQSLSIPVLANGDIDSPHKAQQVLDYTKADGLLIGRASQGKPWLFQQINHYLKTGEELAPPTPDKIYGIINRHLGRMHDFYGSTMGVRIARKHIAWYLADIKGAKEFRSQFNQLDCPLQQKKQLQIFWHILNGLAAA